MFRLFFLAIFRPNKEPEFRYIKCAPGIPLGAHFIYLNSGFLLGLKIAKK